MLLKMNYKYLNYFIILLLIILLIILILQLHLSINFHKYWYPSYYNNITIPSKDIINNNLSNIKLKRINVGNKIANNKTLVICCLARNVEKNIKLNIQKLEYIGKHFKNYKIVIFENDSKDNTRQLLKKWCKHNNNVILLKCNQIGGGDNCILKNKTGYQYGVTSSNRMSKMALYRDQYLQYVLKHYNHYDYMLVCDFDLEGNIDLNGLFHSISYKNWDAIFCNGRVQFPLTFGLTTIPYDSLAYVSINDTYQNNIVNNNYSNINLFISKDIPKYNYMNYKLLIYSYYNQLLPVKSAFNGYGIYKIKSLKNCSYIGNHRCEHINLAQNISIQNNGKLFINPNWKGYFNIQGPTNIIDWLK